MIPVGQIRWLRPIAQLLWVAAIPTIILAALIFAAGAGTEGPSLHGVGNPVFWLLVGYVAVPAAVLCLLVAGGTRLVKQLGLPLTRGWAAFFGAGAGTLLLTSLLPLGGAVMLGAIPGAVAALLMVPEPPPEEENDQDEQ